MRASGHFCLADHYKRLSKNNIRVDYTFWYLLRAPHLANPWVGITWFQPVYVGNFDENEFITIKHDGVLTHHDALAETPFDMSIDDE